MSPSVVESAPKWSKALSPAERQAWRTTFEATSRLREILERQLRTCEGLGLSDYEVLVKLSEASGKRLRMSELSRQVTQSPSQLSQRIDRMVRNGQVVRERVTDDRRGFYAVLTNAGLDCVNKAAPGHMNAVRDFFIARLRPDEIEVVGVIFARLAAELLCEQAEQLPT